ncbi:hypothetical protein PG995_007669 [Apiospora arundinis]
MPSTSLGKRQWDSTWAGLPTEIRLMIFQALIQDGCPLSGLVTVSEEWRSQLEPYNFADIRVRPSNLVEFASMTRRSRALVRYIWFCVELNEYEYCACWWHDSVNTDHWLIRAALAGLFSILSTWEASENLILDISVYSPSDKDHWFKYLTFLPDIPSGDEVTQMELDKYYDELHESASGVPYSATPSGAILRSFRTTTQYSPLASEFNWLEGLPMVPAVTSLRVRQQSRWRWLSPSLGPMLACFPRLEEIHYEPWRNWGHNQGTDDIGNEILLYMLPRFIKNLKRVVIFENFNQQYPAIIQRESTLFPSYCDSVRKPCPGAGEKMAIASLGLGHLAASFMVDARHFFAAIEPDWRWPQLMSLVLTSTCLRPGERRTAKIEALLRAAAAAVMRMPRLETMEIWNGRKGLAALFRYQACPARREATISWRCTWDLALEPCTIQAWKVAVQQQDEGWELVVDQKWLNEASIKSHGDAILQLGLLSSNIIRPISWRQIQCEQRALEGLPTVE